MHIQLPRLRTALALSVVAVYALTGSVMARTTAQELPDTFAKVTGGGTISLPLGIASFGINAQRPANYVPGSGAAQGRVNYNRHFQALGGRHVNAPVAYMVAETVPSGPNNTGGNATLVGNCQAPGAECPSGFNSFDVYVEDNGDSGAGRDLFEISFCSGAAALPTATFPATSIGCGAFEGNTLRSGNIQIRPQNTGGGNAPAQP